MFMWCFEDLGAGMGSVWQIQYFLQHIFKSVAFVAHVDSVKAEEG